MARAEPRRTCIATRAVRPPEELIRFVLAPSGEVVPDLRSKLPGRGAWVTATREAVTSAVARRLFSRSFRREAKAPPELPDAIEALLVADLRQALALANKAGVVITGFHKVESALEAGEAIALIHAAEAAEDGRRKLLQALRRRFGDQASTIPIVESLSGSDLDLALGRSHVIHAALVAGAGGKGFLERWRRLCVYRGSIAVSAAPLAEGDQHDEDEPAGS